MALRTLDKPSTWILSFLSVYYLIRLFYIAYLPLAPDEAYYWYWSKHLDWSYYDHPPMVAYVMALFTALGGDSEFFVRLGGLLCSVLGLVLLYHAGTRLFPKDSRFSWEVLLILNMTLLFSAGCIIQTPDTPMLLFWTAALYCGVRIITEGRAYWWYAWGVALGMGLLSKYTMILAVPCQLSFLLFSRPHRHWLTRREPYVALFIAGIIFSPVLVWNWQHGWLSFAFQSRQGFSVSEEFVGSKLLEYVGGQAGVITPGIFLGFVIYTLKGFCKLIREEAPEYLYLALYSWPVLAFFAVSTAVGEVAEANWPAPAYVAGLMLMWAMYRRACERRPVANKAFMHVSVGLALVMSIVVHVHLMRPIVPLSPGKDVANQFRGWQDLGEAIDKIIATYPHDNGYFLVAERGPALAEAVYYSKKAHIGIDLTRSERYVFLRDTSRLKGKNALILLRTVDESALERYLPEFESLVAVGRHEPRYRDEVLKEFSFFIILGQGYRGV